ncbi:hypothetical protein CVIRNUC_002463 [Coccomyxa viridis]|uniref:Uncharacterized protein n=1 Tax=Coccomyxa viridis TaxID=1274662 RepID=A0AAV1HXG5_9CHLO|nr:hypothetical protein CVIRNUC_002463 [Coccomyxa viridis]
MPSDFQLISRIDTDRSGGSIQRLIHASDASSSTAAGSQEGSSASSASRLPALAVPESVQVIACKIAQTFKVPAWMQEYIGIKHAEPLPPCMSLAWHPATSQVAIASSHSHVHVCNAGAAPSRRQKQDAADLQSELLLWHEVQQQIGALAWRPSSGQQLAVGCSNGVCLWSFGKCPAGGAPALKVAVGGIHQTAWLSFLRTYRAGPVISLAWHPNGSLLAAAVRNTPGFTMFDVSSGLSTPVAAGLTPASLLSWSPNGEYVLEGSIDGSFRIWECHKWTDAAWASQGSMRPLCGAAWAPDSKAVLVANKGSRQLVALYFTQQPPGLEAQTFPVSLPACGVEAGLVQGFAWDAAGERLAVALDGAQQRVAVFATAYEPIMTLRFLGSIPLSPEESRNRNSEDLEAALAFSAGGILASRTSKTRVQLHLCDQL